VASTLIGNVKGPSAYDIAKAAGFVGTEAQWLASLVGDVTPAATNAKVAAEAAASTATNAKVAAEAALVTVNQKIADVPTPEELTATYAAMTTLGITVPTGDTLTHAALQAAADAAVTNGTRVWAAGPLTTDQTLILKSDATLGGLTINYNGAGVAVQIGSGVSGALVSRKNIALPRVFNASKVAAGWLGETTGVKIINANTCVIDVPHVKNFVTGLHVTGLGQGAVHNTVTLGHLDNNKVNQLLDADSTGWSNQNLYLNGNLSHNSEEGSAIAGVRHLQIANGLVHDVNNNTWVNTSFEYITPEFHLDLAGSANQFINCRWEAAGGVRVRWQSTATGNQIMYGYGARLIVQTSVAGATRNHIYHENGGSRPSGGAVALENTSSSASPVEYVLDPGATAGAVNPATAYRAKRSADATHMKRAADAFDRVRFDHVNGRVYFGNGVADPTAYLGAIGTAFGLWGVATQTTAPAAGAAAALPATPAGYVTLYIAGIERKLPYY
jgi:hypothetical protein